MEEIILYYAIGVVVGRIKWLHGLYKGEGI